MNIPIVLIIFRLCLAPVILFLAFYTGEQSSLIILVLMFLGLLSDIFDGIIARKQNTSTEKLRRLDSQVDMVFWLSIGISTYILHPKIIEANQIAVYLLITLEIFCYVVSFIKFGKETCTHAYLSKLWGLSLFVCFISLLGFGHAGIPFYLCLVLGLIAHIDVILIILILPRWTHDVPSFYHAYLIRNNIKFKKSVYFHS